MKKKKILALLLFVIVGQLVAFTLCYFTDLKYSFFYVPALGGSLVSFIFGYKPDLDSIKSHKLLLALLLFVVVGQLVTFTFCYFTELKYSFFYVPALVGSLVGFIFGYKGNVDSVESQKL
ncbi:hypothetical protein [Winogradskyella schleiferi]|uniref:hypothetical protein n=1 Tax=Winogradskyella schleiferi TaxID=2686078 RepID=UPI0015B7AE4B|nr:hypothetical protein [Winogradskyella schleiferi]